MQTLRTVRATPSFWPDVVPEITDEDAQGKLCIGPEGCGTYSLGPPGQEERRCAGSRCMAWVRGRDIIEIAVYMGFTLGKVSSIFFVGEAGYRDVKISDPEDYRPEGEDWIFSHLHGGTDIGHWWRVVAPRGYCGFMPEKPVRPVGGSRTNMVVGRDPNARYTDGRRA